MSKTETFPVDSFKEAAPLLRRPFTAAAVKFKVQSTWPKDDPTGGLVVAYIDARLAVERLNLVCPHLWFDEYQPIQGGLLCRLTVDAITRHDIGEGVGKALYSDALKRAAVKFGVGVSLYAIPQSFIGTADGSAKAKRSNKGPTLVLTDSGERAIRARYRDWLKNIGVQAFGEPLDHGDVEHAQGDPEADTDLAGGTTGTTAPANAGRASSSSARPAKHESDVTQNPANSDTWTEETIRRLKDTGVWDDAVLLKEGLKAVDVVPAAGAQRKTTIFRLTSDGRERFREWIDRMAEQALVDAAKESLGAEEQAAAEGKVTER